MKLMRAIVYTSYGPPETLQLAEIEKPIPRDKQVLVKVHADSVNALEWRGFTMPSPLIGLMGGGFFKPKDPKVGIDVAGTVEAVGSSRNLDMIRSIGSDHIIDYKREDITRNGQQ
jgi:NADPH:quinone reductase-like Zn-dependent oxidoreductase